MLVRVSTMPLYRYKVRDKYGLLIRGRVSAASENAVFASLKTLNYSILSVTPLSPFEERFLQWTENLKGISQKEILSITRQLASMIHAGLPVLTCLNNIIQQTSSPKLKKVLERIALDIEGGSSLANAVGKHPKLFPPFFVSMINVGEISGRLDDVLNRLVNIGKQEAEIKAKLVTAMLYPLILLCLSGGVLSYLLVAVMPKFIAVYSSLSVTVPLPTQILLAVSGFLKNFWAAASTP